MSNAAKFFLIDLLSLFLMASVQPVYSQTSSYNWPRVQFIDKLVETNLREFVRVARPRFIHLSFSKDPVDSGYVYKLYSINEFETVRDFNSPAWGQWETCFILFYGEASPASIYHITGRSSPVSLKRYGETKLPKMVITLTDGKTQQMVGPTKGEGPMVEFKVVKDKEVYYHDQGWIREVPIIVPPVPETTKK